MVAVQNEVQIQAKLIVNSTRIAISMPVKPLARSTSAIR